MATSARHQAGPVFDPTACHIAFRSGRANGSVPQGMSPDGTAGKSCLLLSLMNPTKVRLRRAGLHSLLQHNEETSCNLRCFTRQTKFKKCNLLKKFSTGFVSWREQRTCLCMCVLYETKQRWWTSSATTIECYKFIMNTLHSLSLFLYLAGVKQKHFSLRRSLLGK